MNHEHLYFISLAHPSRVGVLKKLIIESTEAHQHHTENTEELRLKCFLLENELEFANRDLPQLHSTVQLLATETDRANSNVRELVRCFDYWARDPLYFPMIRDLRRLRGLITSVDFSGPRRIGNINGNNSDIGSD